eukprot:11159802-Lingulodinium_polyedra.AAC.1
MELWVARQLPYGTGPEGHPLRLQRDHLAVARADPSLLVVAFRAPRLKLGLMVAHVPHRSAAVGGKTGGDAAEA